MAKKNDEREPSAFAKVLKWAGAITALLSLVFAMQKLVQSISENRERSRNAEELYKVGKLQQSSLDYPAAWKTFESGLQTAQTGGHLAKLTGQLDKEERKFRAAQEDLAMEWLENVHINPDRETFTAVVKPLAEVLTRGITSASGARKADLLAHLGWSNFLRLRDPEVSQLTPEPQYKQALQEDSLNPYAHAYLAHWELWTHHAAALPEANAHFAAALRSGRARADVRLTQVAAIRNLQDEGEPELLRLMSDMRKSNDSIDERTRMQVFNNYEFVCHGFWNGSTINRAEFEALRGAIPIEEHDAILQTLIANPSEGQALQRDACRAVLREQSGQRDEALRIWTALRQSQSADGQWRAYADAAIKRLSQAQRN